jgi:hypothetical protein
MRAPPVGGDSAPTPFWEGSAVLPDAGRLGGGSALSRRRWVHLNPAPTDIILKRELKAWWHDLERHTSLRLPELSLTALTCGAIFCALGSVFAFIAIGAICNSAIGWLALPAFAAAMCVGRYGPVTYPCGTFGELSAAVAALNPARLTQPSGVIRTADVWTSLIALSLEQPGFDTPIGPQTLVCR